jgi:hypothetical protein
MNDSATPFRRILKRVICSKNDGHIVREQHAESSQEGIFNCLRRFLRVVPLADVPANALPVPAVM